MGCFILGLVSDLLAVCEKFEGCGGVGVILIGICWLMLGSVSVECWV